MLMQTSGELLSVINGLSNITGSLFLSLLMIAVLLMVILLAFGLPVELSAVVVLPLFLVLMAYDATFYRAGGALLIYLGFIIAKNWILR